MSVYLFIWTVIIGPACGLEFGHNLGSHMVLQRAPEKAILHGYADVIGDTVTISKNGTQVGTTQVKHSSVNGTIGYWEFLLPAESHPGPFTITASCKDGAKTLTDILYGDIWVCSGQSNMYFQMRQVFNSTDEITRALTYSDVRIMSSKLVKSNTSEEEAHVQISWTKPVKGKIDYFSAVCFMFGRNLRDHLKRPIGLIESSWGGTKIEVWSSPDAMAACPDSSGKRAPPSTPSILWNAMINPILKTTIKGAIWYQGESNGPANYDCRFQAMISDWRQKFHTESLGQTNSNFPFGFVQFFSILSSDMTGVMRKGAFGQKVLIPTSNHVRDAVVARDVTRKLYYGQMGVFRCNVKLGTFKDLPNGFGFAGTRWEQTAHYGYVPNPKMPKTFMAVALDLPDTTSPYGAVHPRDKEDVADRLTFGARVVAYGESSVVHQGPYPTDYRMDSKHQTLDIVYDHNKAHLTVHNTSGFEICCDSSPTSQCQHGQWLYTTMVSHTQSSVTVKAACSHHGYHVAGIRYLWRITPCGFKACPVYRVINNLPAPPFIKVGGFTTDGPAIVG